MLQFAKKCPEPVKLWETIMDTGFPTVYGIKDVEVIFTLFMGFRITGDFTEFKRMVNNWINDPNEYPYHQLKTNIHSILRTKYEIDPDVEYNTNLVDNAQIPHIEGLLAPSIMIRDLLRTTNWRDNLPADILGIDANDSFLDQLHEDTQVESALTMYKLFYETISISNLVIDESSQPVEVSSKEEMLGHITNTCIAILSNELSVDSVTIPRFQYVASAIPSVEMSSAAASVIAGDDATDAATYSTKVPMGTGDTASSAPSDDWIPWSGGECPVDPDTRVECRFDEGSDCEGDASAFEWGAHSLPVVAYRVIKPELSWDDIRVGTKLKCNKTTSLRTNGDIYKITKIVKNAVYLESNDNGQSAGTAEYWQQEEFTIEEI